MTAIDDNYRHLYESYYDGPSDWRTLGARGKAQRIVELCARVPHANILEIGAGDGAVLDELSRRGFGEKFFAVEVSATAIEAIGARGIRGLAECKVFDGDRTDFPDGAFDLVIMTHVVEHLEHPRQLLYEARRLGTRVFVEVPLEDTLRLRRDYLPNAEGHINYYNPNSVRRLAQTCGLEVEEQIVRNSSMEIYRSRAPRLGLVRYAIKEVSLRAAPWAATRIFTYMCSLLCRSPVQSARGTDVRRRGHL